MTRQQAPIAAVILGVALAIGLRYGREELQAHLVPPTFGGVLPAWVPFFSPLIQVLVLLVPGFVSGWVASRRQLLCGFLAGPLGAAIYQPVIATSWPAITAEGMS